MNEPIRTSLMQPVLIMGCEWKPFGVFFSVIFSILVMAFPRIRGAFDALFFLSIIAVSAIGVVILRYLAEKDPQYFGVSLRSRRYPRHIRAYSTPFRKDIDYSKSDYGNHQNISESLFM